VCLSLLHSRSLSLRIKIVSIVDWDPKGLLATERRKELLREPAIIVCATQIIVSIPQPGRLRCHRSASPLVGNFKPWHYGEAYRGDLPVSQTSAHSSSTGQKGQDSERQGLTAPHIGSGRQWYSSSRLFRRPICRTSCPCAQAYRRPQGRHGSPS
jgi:hypothetical protein